MDPIESTKYLLDSNPEATFDFSKEEKDLYQDVLKEAAGCIKDISKK